MYTPFPPGPKRIAASRNTLAKSRTSGRNSSRLCPYGIQPIIMPPSFRRRPLAREESRAFRTAVPTRRRLHRRNLAFRRGEQRALADDPKVVRVGDERRTKEKARYDRYRDDDPHDPSGCETGGADARPPPRSDGAPVGVEQRHA